MVNNKNNKKISVIVPAYNAANFIETSIESIQKQTYTDVDIIVVDDGSTDETVTICQNLNVTLLQQTHKGVAAARNLGIRAAKGHFIAFLDADDFWLPNKLTQQMEVFEKQPFTDMVFGFSQAINKDKQPLFNPMFIISLGAMLAKKDIFERISYFDETLTLGSDMDWFLRVLEKKCISSITSDFVLKFRRHEFNMTNDMKATKHFFLKAIKNSLDRRRRENQGQITQLSPLVVPQ